MPNQMNMPVAKPLSSSPTAEDYRLLYFSELLKRPVRVTGRKERIGRVSDLVFRLAEPYPEAAGIYIEHGWGQPAEFAAWDKVIRIEPGAVIVARPDNGESFPPFVDQPGWILVNEHLMGRTILDMDGRKIEVVNDVHLLESRGRMLIVHVDISFNGFLRKWGLGRFSRMKDSLISWRYVQPLSLEDVGAKDAVTLSLTRQQIHELPSEDLADALEELSGDEQQAVFSVLDDEKAAETLIAAEPRTQRQLVADLRREKARNILSEMSVPQLADLFSVLPHDEMMKMIELVPPEESKRIMAIISEQETTAQSLMSGEFLTAGEDAQVKDVLARIRGSANEPETISYVYVVAPDTEVLLGVADLREMILASDSALLKDIMVSPVVSALRDDTRETLEELFAKYCYRMIPVVDENDCMFGVVKYKDIMAGLEIRPRR
ncbi:MAG: CBS domain-containing protein [Candidatus Sumerlaeota bacterium]|nr:CBS domain-containing protein [Candidatus Sumerlaeota bacterium]